MNEFISSLAGAFFGAIAAFLLEAWRRRHERQEQRFSALQDTLAVLLSQLNSAKNMRSKIGGDEGGNPFDNFKQNLVQYSQREIDFSSLTFLAESSTPQLLLDLEVTQDTFLYLARVTDKRNQMLREFFGDSGTKVLNFDPITGNVTVTGSQRALFDLKAIHSHMLEAFEKTVSMNTATGAALYAFSRQTFPRRKVVFGILKPAGEPVESLP